MKQIYLLLIFYIYANILSSQSNINFYEYWFDSDLVNKISTSITPVSTYEFNGNISTNYLTDGLHSFHIRFRDDNSVFSSVLSQLFIKLNSGSESNMVSAYEYWFNNNYHQKVFHVITPQSSFNLATELNTDALKDGLHTFHIRFQEKAGIWSSVTSQFIFKLKNSTANNYISSYRYWFDTIKSTIRTVNLNNPINPLNLLTQINTSILDTGTHSISLQFLDRNGFWSSVMSCGFYKGEIINIPNILAFECNNSLERKYKFFHNAYLQNVHNLIIDNDVYSNNAPVKICADGSRSTYFKIKVASDRERFGFRILKGDRSVASAADQDSTGLLGTVYPIEGNSQEVEVAYTAPTDMDIPALYRSLTLQITFDGQPIPNGEFPIHIYRAPIAFVHGLWGDTTTFAVMRDSLVKDELYPNLLINRIDIIRGECPIGGTDCYLMYLRNYHPLLHIVDYEKDAGKSFVTNFKNGVIPIAIDSVLTTSIEDGFSCGKAIVVCHSMGGILSRLYLQSNSREKHPYRNDICKLITISTPHLGSQFGNLVFDPGFKWRRRLLDLFKNIDAVEDLRVNSWEITKWLNGNRINLNKVPSVSLGNTFSSFTGLEEKGISVTKVYNTLRGYEEIIMKKCGVNIDLFQGDYSDLIVPLKSQMNAYKSKVSDYNRWHIGQSRSRNVIKDVSFLVSAPTNESNFTFDGFMGGDIKYFSSKCQLIGGLLSSKVDSLEILNPSNGATFNQGDSVFLDIYVTPGIVDFVTYIYTVDGPILGEEVSSSRFRFNLVDLGPGSYYIYLIGIDDLTNIFQDSVLVSIKSPYQLTKIIASPFLNSVSPFETFQLRVDGEFSDGKRYNLNIYDRLKFVFNSEYLSKIGSAYFSGNGVDAKTAVIAEIDGLYDTVFVDINSQYELKIADFSVSDNYLCSSGAVRFKDRSYGRIQNRYWHFPGGNPSTSSEPNPEVYYKEPGDYPVMLICDYGDFIDTLYREEYISVLAPPKLDFRLPPMNAPTVYGGCSAILDAGNPGSTYLWSTGDTCKLIEVYKSAHYFVTVTDERGCASTGSVYAAIEDNIKPVVKGKPANLVLDPQSNTVMINPSILDNGSMDNCGIGKLSVSQSLFGCRQIGNNVVHLIVTDKNGNSASTSTIVNVVERVPPTISCPPNIRVEAKSGLCPVAGSSVSLGIPAALMDNCTSPLTATNNKPSSFPIGSSLVTWTVTDGSGNKSSCSQQVIVYTNSCAKPGFVVSSNITRSSALVRWSGTSCASGYELRIRRSTSPSTFGAWSPWVAASGPGNSHLFSNLTANSYYHYQIRSLCYDKYSTEVSNFFTTLSSAGGDLSAREMDINLDENSFEPKVEVMPNPANQYLFVAWDNFSGADMQIGLYDVYGHLIYQTSVDGAYNGNLTWDLQEMDIPSGVYWLKVSDTGYHKTIKLVIE